MQPIDYFPIEYLFNLLSLCRKGAGVGLQALRTAMRKRELWSETASQPTEWEPPKRMLRLSFWVRLSQAASLLTEDPFYYPTLLAREWLSWPFYEQLAFLFRAWLQAPKSEIVRNIRRILSYRLRENTGEAGISLSTSYRRELPGLQLLGICEGDRLSELGRKIIGDHEAEKFDIPKSQRWSISNDQLMVPYPPDWKLLWDLEGYLEPSNPGIYSLSPTSLRLGAKQETSKDRPSFIEILKQGLRENPPEWLVERSLDGPSIRVLPGLVLEFSDPEELKSLRRSRGLRRDLDKLLSPRHVSLDPWRAWQVLGLLWRKGLISERDLTSSIQAPGHASERSLSHLNKADRVYLLSLILLAEGLQQAILPPPGLLRKLTENMDHSLRAAAARRATRALANIRPKPDWQPEEEAPLPPPDEVIETIQMAIDREESIDVLYKASGRHRAEYRHLTPLLLEKRGERYYLIAYCHLRRANRTFRLDRLKLYMD